MSSAMIFHLKYGLCEYRPEIYAGMVILHSGRKRHFSQNPNLHSTVAKIGDWKIKG
jgi:hypothetical protein